MFASRSEPQAFFVVEKRRAFFEQAVLGSPSHVCYVSGLPQASFCYSVDVHFWNNMFCHFCNSLSRFGQYLSNICQYWSMYGTTYSGRKGVPPTGNPYEMKWPCKRITNGELYLAIQSWLVTDHGNICMHSPLDWHEPMVITVFWVEGVSPEQKTKRRNWTHKRMFCTK